MNWFSANSKKTIFGFLIFFIINFDLIAGLILIPKQYNEIRCPNFFYHHDFCKNSKTIDKWGDTEYPLITNSLGFKDSTIREISLVSSKRRVVIIGDSFTEGQGVSYGDSFVGLMNAAINKKGIEIHNAGVSSYSPKLYFLKIKHLLENVKFKFDELFVLIDISDIQNEIIYKYFEPMDLDKNMWIAYKSDKLMRKYSFTYYALNEIGKPKDINNMKSFFWNDIFPSDQTDIQIINRSYDYPFLASWIFDKKIYKQYGEKGLKLAKSNMDKLLNLCKKHNIKISIGVYPWPFLVSKSVSNNLYIDVWKKYSSKNNISFVNLFRGFINDKITGPKSVKKYYIKGDVHWNKQGHQIIADQLLSLL